MEEELESPTKPSTKPTMEFDEVFEHIGGIGLYQKLLIASVLLTSALITEVIYLNFMLYEMPHWCKITDESQGAPVSSNLSYFASLSADHQKNIAIPFDGESYSKCERYDLNFTSMTEMEIQQLHTDVPVKDISKRACTTWEYDESLFEENAVTRWDLVCENSMKRALPSTLFLFGILVASFLCSVIGDRLGRRKSYFLWLLVDIAGTLMYMFPLNWSIFVAGWFLDGMGVSALYITTFALGIECVGKDYRHIVGLLQPLAYSVGYMTVPLFAYLIRDTLNMLLWARTPFLIFLFTYPLIPESPRWLLINEKYESAASTLSLIAKVNKKALPKDFDVRLIKVNIEEKGSILDMVRTRQMCLYSLALVVNWLTISTLYYALSLNAGVLTGNVFLNTFLMGLVEIPAGMIVMKLSSSKKLGRKYTHLMAMMISGLAVTLCVPFIAGGWAPSLVTALSIIAKGGSSMGFNMIYLITSEIYPTSLRSTAIGIHSMFARVGAMLAQLSGVAMTEAWKPLPSLLYGLLGLSAAFLTLLLPETLDTNLPDTMADRHNLNMKDRQLVSHAGSPLHDTAAEAKNLMAANGDENRCDNEDHVV